MTPQIGHGTAGIGPNAITVSTVLGDRDGPTGVAWTGAIAAPSMGHSPFVVVAKPNLPVVPLTLLVPAIGVVAQRHAELTMGAAHAGLAAAVLDLKMDDPEGDHCLIASVWVPALAVDDELVFFNTRDAAMAALKMGAAGGPWHGHLAEVDQPENEFFRGSSSP